jgi:hypothetical protein
MRNLVGACAFVASLAACGGGSETITEAEGPFVGIYSLRQVNDAPLPLYFSPAWYPGRGSGPNVLFTTMLSGDLIVRGDGTFTWSTLLEEVSSKPNTVLQEFVVFKVRRETTGGWTYTESTGAVSLQGIDPSGYYHLAGSAASTSLTLSTNFPSGPNSTFVLER